MELIRAPEMKCQKAFLGAMVKCLERFNYGAESHRKFASSRLGFAIRRQGNSVDPAVNGYLFELGKAKAAKGEGWAFISCAQDTVGL